MATFIQPVQDILNSNPRKLMKAIIELLLKVEEFTVRCVLHENIRSKLYVIRTGYFIYSFQIKALVK